MLYEELFKYDGKNEKEIGEHFYIATLMYWLLNNELDIFDQILIHFQDKEQYLVCHGINRAIEKIEDTIEYRFDEAASEVDSEEEKVYSVEEYKRVSKEIFKDILLEIYECQIKNNQEIDREGNRSSD